MTPNIEPDLILTLARVAELAAPTQDSWWVFGGAAAALHGAEQIDAHDVDVLLSSGDVKVLLRTRSVGGVRATIVTMRYPLVLVFFAQ